MTLIFNPTNWYWFVGGDKTQAYSSASGSFVPAADATFQAWQTSGGVATNIDTAANLGGVLTTYSIRPVDAGVLDGYQGTQATTIIGHPAFKIAFNHENRLRAIERNLGLNGSPAALTAPQAVAMVKGLM